MRNVIVATFVAAAAAAACSNHEKSSNTQAVVSGEQLARTESFFEADPVGLRNDVYGPLSGQLTENLELRLIRWRPKVGTRSNGTLINVIDAPNFIGPDVIAFEAVPKSMAPKRRTLTALGGTENGVDLIAYRGKLFYDSHAVGTIGGPSGNLVDELCTGAFSGRCDVAIFNGKVAIGNFR